MYNPGRNRTRVEVYDQKNEWVENELGEYIPVKPLKFTDWAEVIGQSGKEVLENRKTEHNYGIRLSMRYRKDLDKTDLLMIQGEEIRILAILPNGRYMEVVGEWQK